MFRKFEIVSTPNAAARGRADMFWKKNNKFLKAFKKFRKPERKLPGVFENARILDQQGLLKYFSLAGFEYGSWIDNNTRFEFLYGCVVSLLDLRDLTGIKSLGFGLYTIAFGARGKGGRGSAAAHFEPRRHAINLTKEYGLEALAHEYGHLLDHFFGCYIDQDKLSQYLSLGKLNGKISLRVNGLRKGTLRYLMQEVIKAIVFDSKGNVTPYYTRLTKEAKSEYFTASTELFARAFEQWVTYQLKKKGVVNKFLSQPKYEHWMYLSPAHFKKVSPKINALIKAMAVKAK
ncbi:LPD1 domain-containing protein [Lentimicrobium sp. S6]|uniref:LPD1 domain-containing protein n=1 Tax=Lentimicrobium sp. S6 TaxID=2735872 RepID=UPI001551F8AE|nr:LPD1 domain-containing protein [Lentimicrobium sp. S6]NPD47485.1 hypothetical protein [Lentimicrobium sp. S6]